MIDEEKISQITIKFPLIHEMTRCHSVLWINSERKQHLQSDFPFSFTEVEEAKARLDRFSSYIKVAFPETQTSQGIIESDIKEIPAMKKLIEGRRGFKIPGKLILKCDHSLPISGSIKARGGIYEVLKLAETLAIREGLLSLHDDYSKLAEDSFKQFFSQYKIAVGSTGNLGLSIGIMGAKLGFQVIVHMSSEAKEWKKQLLRKNGVTVIEYTSDYSKAVLEGRNQAKEDERCYFVDDENSSDLFAGYAVAALRLQEQLQRAKVKVDEDHPLFVYLPCGVGGAPGGVAYGLKSIYGNDVHIFFGEPIQSPCMTLGMMTGLHDEVSVQDFGFTNSTEADGLAVGRASKFVGKLMEPIISGCYTVDDSFLFRSLKAMYEQENIFMEPSAHAGVFGPIQLISQGKQYLEEKGLASKMNHATHLVWSTGGQMVPFEERQMYLQKDV
ncbi:MULTISPECIES: D-serine ammonia-lyase [Lysinibacillus]|uniref:Probable D-serine dehydratase n=1 Tax=Lysinibacillus antri TaxID=2498145 RepID=A0A432LGI0_9BACI|nr:MULTISPECIES: D-serine ammonia-lyase [Lysinibacillus]RUL55534.1 D-serine ammonia-lyase [Lysinibacillus antri]TSI09098.1 D-serine ammonia-lyase [Lysinibacillus sp. BW-2-10]